MKQQTRFCKVDKRYLNNECKRSKQEQTTKLQLQLLEPLNEKKKLIKTVNRRKRKACSKDKWSNCEALTFSTKTKIQSARAKFGAKKNSSYVDY